MLKTLSVRGTLCCAILKLPGNVLDYSANHDLRPLPMQETACPLWDTVDKRGVEVGAVDGPVRPLSGRPQFVSRHRPVIDLHFFLNHSYNLSLTFPKCFSCPAYPNHSSFATTMIWLCEAVLGHSGALS